MGDPPSPKSKVNVKETSAKFEGIQEKYRNQRNLKDTAKDKAKFKRTCKKVPTESVEDPVAKMLKEMMQDIKEIKNDVKGNNVKIDHFSEKVETIETKQKETDEKNEKTFDEIKDDLANVESRVTDKLMAEIQPSLSVMKNDIQHSIGVDLRHLVQEEVTLQRHREAKEKNVVDNDPGDPEKNIKIQKNNKTINTKKIEESTAVPEEGSTSAEEEPVEEESVEPEK